MELVELHVRDLGAGPVRHGDAVAGRDVRIRRVEVDLPRPAGREHGRPREDGDDLAGRDVEHVRARADLRAAELRQRDEVDGRVLLEDADARVPLERLEQRTLHLAPRHVLRVGDAPRAVSPFEVQIEVGVVLPLPRCPVEVRADGLQRPDALRPLLHAHLDGSLVAEPGSGDERVLDVRLERVLRVEDRRDPPLRVLRVRLVARALRDEDDVAVRRGFQREGQPRDAAADDEVVTADGHSPRLAWCRSLRAPCALRRAYDASTRGPSAS